MKSECSQYKRNRRAILKPTPCHPGWCTECAEQRAATTTARPIAPDWETQKILTRSSNRDQIHVSSLQIGGSFDEAQTRVARFFHLMDFDFIVDSLQDHYIGPKDRNDNHWTERLQRPFVSLLIPSHHTKINTSKLDRLFMKLLKHPNLAVTVYSEIFQYPSTIQNNLAIANYNGIRIVEQVRVDFCT